MNTFPYLLSHSCLTSSSSSRAQESPVSSAGSKQFLSKTHRLTSGAATIIFGFGGLLLAPAPTTGSYGTASSLGSSRASFLINASRDELDIEIPKTSESSKLSCGPAPRPRPPAEGCPRPRSRRSVSSSRGTVSAAKSRNRLYRSRMACVLSFVNLSFPRPTRIARPPMSSPFNFSRALTASSGSRYLTS
jgi:hypothetical protein